MPGRESGGRELRVEQEGGRHGDHGKGIAETDSTLVMVLEEVDRPEAHPFFLQHKLEMRILTRS